MKNKSDMRQVAGDKRPIVARAAFSCHLSPATRHSEKGIALIITLILLSVTLIMAVAFLAISRRERGSVVTSTDTATARLAADAALANAEAQIIANVFATTNPYNYGLLVSTNYQNSYGYVPNSQSPTNVNYDYRSDGTALNVQDFLQNVANLYYLPRPPVFVPTNSLGSNEFRFYLDLNRNGKFEDSGNVINFEIQNGVTVSNGTVSEIGDPQWIGVLERPDAPHGPNNKFLSRYAFIAMPVGNELDLNYIHNQSLHGNASALVNPPPVGDTFFRNQGVGSWEINLAAFLADLNINQWDPPTAENNANDPYQYIPPPLVGGNKGVAFDDARALLAYRYNNNYNSLAYVSALFPNYSLPGSVDLFPFGLAMSSTAIPFYNYGLNNSWPGADNTNHFFALTSDLFNDAETEKGVTAPALGFTDRLLNASTNISTYDRYTFYRLLAQLGTDSTAESGKMNLNYDNLDPAPQAAFHHPGVTNAAAATNFMAWTPIAFFTNAADRMLRLYTTNWFQGSASGYFTNYTTVTNWYYTAPSNYLATYYGIHTNYFSYIDEQGRYIWNAPSGFGLTNIPYFGITNQVPAFGITNIPVYVNRQFVYSSAIQRVLQLAANIYDATTNSVYPSVFRPLFEHDNFGNVFIAGYTNLFSIYGLNTVAGVNDPQLGLPYDVASLTNYQANFTLMATNNGFFLNVYGVPWIIGAKKGLPNFNEFAMENNLAVTRRLQLSRTTNASPNVTPTITGTNQMYTMKLDSSIGVELWNSYSNRYPNPVVIGLNESAGFTINNNDDGNGGVDQITNLLFAKTYFTNVSFTTNFWPGSGSWSGGNPNSASFVLPLNVSTSMLTNCVYRSYYANGNSAYTLGLVAPGFVPTNYFTGSSLLFETNSPNGFYLPQFSLLMTNRLQIFMLDQSNGIYHVIDYVHFAGPESSINVNSALVDADIGDTVNHATGTGVWDTNYPSGSYAPYGPTWGIVNQITTSKSGNPPQEDGLWHADPEAIPQNGTIAQQVAYFQAFFKPGNKSTATVSGLTATATNVQTIMQAPYSPTRYVVQYLTWQANDPLVHYLASDVDAVPLKNTSLPSPGVTNYNAGTSFNGLTNLNLGSLNDRYSPWGRNPGNYQPTPGDTSLAATFANNMALKDPLMTNSDAWDFPTYKFPTVGWLGRVHRGTPWQTVYLKASNILLETNNNGAVVGTNLWQTWTGDLNTNDAVNARPTQDALLFDIFSTAPNDNAAHGQLSINVAADTNNPAAGLAAWSAMFSGMVVPTSLANTYTVINPAGSAGVPVPADPPASANSPFCLGYLVQNGTNGINDVRAKFTNPDGLVGTFEHVGNILAVPALTENSPFLTGLNPNTQISDEMYEWLPQQAMSLLRTGNEDGGPRYVIYCYGQTLKPAPNGIVTGSTQFGMVTNYQVVAETATRAVVQFRPSVTTDAGGTHTNYNATVEQFNPLPPD
jgi:hypothetical protein